ncbi:hypothetical protein H1D44_18610 [Halomonas kenyensis]|uniref:Uncharacterized protein n=1 Tax=Billgrantia kenyensis TaxID=321266 RepID=A0A7V9W4J0_9GAMM|nr:hypothetical protein [Halomonas kenyensis]MBA2780901.1 hypothetical protein [Halomonas kenyensis]MCG6663638.1 hypothetical protein [Halomonas kenyensis]
MCLARPPGQLDITRRIGHARLAELAPRSHVADKNLAVSSPFTLAGQKFRITVSTGIARYPVDVTMYHMHEPQPAAEAALSMQQRLGNPSLN